jgi:hypothetical protein
MPTRVVNLRAGGPYDVLIDRRSPWGNPFRIDAENSREEVIRRFANWVINDSSQRARWIREHVHELRGKTLACWCAPQACHGDVLAAMAEESEA